MSQDGPIPAYNKETGQEKHRSFWNKLKQIVADNPKKRAYDEDGLFYPDPTPVAPPIGYVQEPSMFDRVREMVKREMSSRAEAEGFESFEEADDFDIADDYEPYSPYELILEQAQPDGEVVNGEETGKDAPPPSPAPKSEPKPKTPSRSEQPLPAAGSEKPAE